MRNMQIGTLTIGGYVIVGLIMIVFAVVAWFEVRQISALTEKLYKHPYAVSTNMRDVKTSIMSMDRAMRDVLLADNPAKVGAITDEISTFEAKALSHFDVVRERFLGDPGQVAKTRKLFLDWKPIRAEIINATAAGDLARARQLEEARGAPHVDQIVASIVPLIASASQDSGAFIKQARAINDETLTLMVVGFVLLMAVASGLAWVTTTNIVPPLRVLSAQMREIADGKVDVEIPFVDRRNEIGAMASALVIFRENAVEMAQLSAERRAMREKTEAEKRAMMSKLASAFGEVVDAAVAGDFSKRITYEFKDPEIARLAEGVNRLVAYIDECVRQTAAVLEAMASADLTAEMRGDLRGVFDDLRQSYTTSTSSLSEFLTNIQRAAGESDSRIRVLSQGTFDLSQRTEAQAASLEEAASTMEELSSTVQGNAEALGSAATVSAEMRAMSGRGSEVATQAVDAVGRIEESSNKITEIISVIEAIAFQTNLLALNAAVEAARAGDAGKGFAVVASEVRTLSHRSSEAAKDISDLIRGSSENVQNGVKLVGATGEVLEEINEAVGALSRQIDDVANAGREQATAIGEMNSTISELDGMTQKNAAICDQTAAETRNLIAEMEQLSKQVGQFTLKRRPDDADRQALTAALGS